MVTPSDFFLTDDEFDRLIVNPDDYLSRVDLSADDSVVAVDGLQLIVVDTTGGPVSVSLESPSVAPSRYSPTVVNVGANPVVVVATINGINNPSIVTSFGGMAIVNNNGEYVSSLKVHP